MTSIPNNMDFGKKQVRIKINGEYYDYDEAKSQIWFFFDKDAENHPGNYTGTGTNRTLKAASGLTPNWFHYWVGVGSDDNAVDVRGQTITYGGSSGTLFQATYTPPSTFVIYDEGEIAFNRTFTFADGSRLDLVSSGISAVTRVLTHELTHQMVDLNNQPGGAWYNSVTNRKWTDTDRDELPDDIEDNMSALGFDKRRSYSLGLSGFYIQGDDEEAYCELQSISASEAGKTKSQIANQYSRDWAKDGKLW